jgi:hypothetical protein
MKEDTNKKMLLFSSLFPKEIAKHTDTDTRKERKTRSF